MRMQIEELYREIRDMRRDSKGDSERIARIEEKLDSYNNLKKLVYETSEACKDNSEAIEKILAGKNFRNRTLIAVLITAPISSAVAVIVTSMLNKLFKG